ncbi:MAG: sodium/solute symporter [Bacteroidota bacterium]
MFDKISVLDVSIIGIYFVMVAVIGYLVSRKTKTGDDLFLGGRSFGWAVIGLSLFASNISTSTIIGLSDAAYKSGIADSVYEWLSGIPLIIAAAIFIPLYLKARITTIPEYLQLRFDRRSRLMFSGMTILTSVLIDMAGGLFAGATIMQIFFPDLSLWTTCLLLAAVAGVYTAFGGLKAVVYTDTIQAVILIVGCTILTLKMFAEFDFDWSQVLATVPDGRLSVVQPIHPDSSLPWTGLLLGVPFLGFWYWTTNQYIVQRVLGARDVKNARWGVMLAGFLKIVPLFIMVIPGALAISLIPGIGKDEAVLPVAMLKYLTPGLLGLVLAGLISAILSSVDSTLNSSSTLVVKDFIESGSGGEGSLTDQSRVRYGRMTTFVLMIVAATVAPLIQYFESLWGYLQSAFGIIAPPVVVVFLVGVFFKRGNAEGAFQTLLWGTLGGLLLFILGLTGHWGFHYTTNVGLMIGISTLIFVGVSLAGVAPEPEKIGHLVYRKGLITEDDEPQPFYADWRYQAVALVALMGTLLYFFW